MVSLKAPVTCNSLEFTGVPRLNGFLRIMRDAGLKFTASAAVNWFSELVAGFSELVARLRLPCVSPLIASAYMAILFNSLTMSSILTSKLPSLSARLLTFLSVVLR